METLTNSSTSHAKENGHNFHCIATIFLFLHFLKEVEKIGVEQNGSIIIYLNDGRKIYAQTKSSLVPDEIQLNKQWKDMYAALENLNAKDADKLITIFNYLKPFGNEQLFEPSFGQLIPFGCLNDRVKRKIQNKIRKEKYDIAVDKLIYAMSPFQGSNEEILDKYGEMLKKKLPRPLVFSQSVVISRWLAAISFNAQRPTEMIDKSKLANILCLNALSSMSAKFAAQDAQVPLSYKAYNFAECFNRMFDGAHYDFFAIAKIRKAYSEFVTTNGTEKERVKQFIEHYCKEVPDYIAQNCREILDPEEQLDLYKAYALHLCSNLDIIDCVKEGFGYEN